MRHLPILSRLFGQLIDHFKKITCNKNLTCYVLTEVWEGTSNYLTSNRIYLVLML